MADYERLVCAQPVQDIVHNKVGHASFAVLSIRICLVLCPKADKGASSGPLIVAVLSIRICLVLCPKADKGASSGPLIVAVLSI